MKTMSADELRRQALSMGAEAVIDGRSFNASRTQIKPAAPKPAAPTIALVPPAPAPAAAEPTFTRSEVERLLAEQETRILAQVRTLTEALRSSAKPGAVPVGFQPKYGRDGEITFVGVQYQQLQ